jgi:hypothetical protein
LSCKRVFCIGEGPEYTLFLHKAELGFFHFLEIVTGWLVPSAGQKIPEQPGWYLLLQKVPLAENRFLHAANGAENTKEKSRQCFPCRSDVSRCNQNLVIIYAWEKP